LTDSHGTDFVPWATVAAMTDALGFYEQIWQYYPFGGDRVAYDSLNNPNTRWWLMNRMKFTGLWRDDETGLDHTLYRKYSSTLGRWLSPDPMAGSIMNPQSLNRYAYVMNNPVNFIDPLGLDECMTGADGQQYCIDVPPIGSTTWAPMPPATWPLWTKAAGYTCMFDPHGFLCQALTGRRTPRVGGGTPPKPKEKGVVEKDAPNPCTGGGFAIVGGGTGALGVLATGAAATGTVGGGAFYNSKEGASAGALASGGATAYFGEHTAGVPTQGRSLDDRAALGGFIGGGAGLLITNAGSAQALKRTTTTFSFDVGLEFGGSIQLSSGGGIWALSITLGPAYGAAFSQLNTGTKAAGGECR